MDQTVPASEGFVVAFTCVSEHNLYLYFYGEEQLETSTTIDHIPHFNGALVNLQKNFPSELNCLRLWYRSPKNVNEFKNFKGEIPLTCLPAAIAKILYRWGHVGFAKSCDTSTVI